MSLAQETYGCVMRSLLDFEFTCHGLWEWANLLFSLRYQLRVDNLRRSLALLFCFILDSFMILDLAYLLALNVMSHSEAYILAYITITHQ